MKKRKLSLSEIKNKIKNINFESFDLVVAIGKGGIEPAKLVANHLKIPLKIINIEFRGVDNKPIYKEPILVNSKIKNNNILKIDRFINKKIKNKKTQKNKNPELILKSEIIDKKILIIDDVSRTGATLKKAKQVLKENKTKTFVINGKADYSLYNFKECIDWPWR